MSDYENGAAACVGLIEMAKSIRARRRKCPTCRCMLSIVEETCFCCNDAALDDLFKAAHTVTQGKRVLKRPAPQGGGSDG